MSFGLKKVGATNQRAMMDLFHNMMHIENEVYVSDMITKYEAEEENMDNLRGLFERLRMFRL